MPGLAFKLFDELFDFFLRFGELRFPVFGH
jgi:hypothetical protein